MVTLQKGPEKILDKPNLWCTPGVAASWMGPSVSLNDVLL